MELYSYDLCIFILCKLYLKLKEKVTTDLGFVELEESSSELPIKLCLFWRIEEAAMEKDANYVDLILCEVTSAAENMQELIKEHPCFYLLLFLSRKQFYSSFACF